MRKLAAVTLLLAVAFPLSASTISNNDSCDIFNILDTQRAVLLDERWGFQEADNASPTPVNPDYGRPVLRTAPRSTRLGVRITF